MAGLSLRCAVTFQEWVDELVATFGSKTKLAQAIGISLTQIGRGRSAGKYSVENLLKLARAANADPSSVLRLAGKGDVADLIETLYGKAELTAEQRALLTAFATVPAPLRPATLHLVKTTGASFGAALPSGRTVESGVAAPGPARASRKAERHR